MEVSDLALEEIKVEVAVYLTKGPPRCDDHSICSQEISHLDLETTETAIMGIMKLKLQQILLLI